MANTDLVLSIPDATTNGNDITLVTGGGTWAYSSWRVVYSNIKTDINIYGIALQLTATPSVDTAEQYIIEIGTGFPDNAVTKVQMPFVMRSDTAVALFQSDTIAYLPEAYTVPAGSTISVRAACGIASRTINGIKIRYTATSSIWTPQTYTNNYQRFKTTGSTSIGGTM